MRRSSYEKTMGNPEVNDLSLNSTCDGTCYCEEGAIMAYGARSAETKWCMPGGKPFPPGFGPGHPHRPPHHPEGGGNCPNEPKPEPPQEDVFS